MVIAITGRNGFIGRHLAFALELRGHKVIGIPSWMLHDAFALREEMRKIQPDYIFHLGAYGNHTQHDNEYQIFKTNVVGTHEMLLATKDISYKGFINFGSSSEYGKKNSPMMECDLLETDTIYGATKVAATYLCRAFAKQYTKPIITVRPFSVYGEGEASFRFIPQIIKHLKDGTPMDVDLDGVHDWIYVKDLVNALLVLMDHSTDLFGQVVNIGTGEMTKNARIIRELEVISEKRLEVNVFGYMRKDDSPVWVDGGTKMRSLAWEPKYSLMEGLEKTYEYYK